MTGEPPDPVMRHGFLDALRGFAFLGVLAVHASIHVPGLPAWAIQLCQLGNYGVQLFFVVSAVTLCLSFAYRSSAEPHPVKAFFVRRFLRIAPMFWAALVFYSFFWNDVFHPEKRDSLIQIAVTFLFVHGWHPATINQVVPGGWSIAVETNFYLLFPLLFRTLRRFRTALLALLITVPVSVGASIALRHWLTARQPGSGELTYYWLPRQLPVFLVGFVVYRAMSSSFISGGLRRGDGRILGLGLFLLSAAVLLSSRLPCTYLVFSVIFGVILLGLSIRPVALFVNPLTRFTGVVSYSAYLTHFAVIDVVAWAAGGFLVSAHSAADAVLRFTAFYLVCWGVTAAVSAVTYRSIELPFQSLGKRLIAGRRGPVGSIPINEGGL